MAEEPFYQSQYPLEDSAGTTPSEEQATVEQSISWTASEYIAHHKTPKWYLLLGLSAVAIAFVVWLFTRDTVSALVIIVGAIALGGYGARQPRELQYGLDSGVLTIGRKQYGLEEFRSFTVDDQQTFSSINLMPLKRFSPGLSIYFAPQDEEAIIAILSQYLPIEEHRTDPIDKLMQRIRF